MVLRLETKKEYKETEVLTRDAFWDVYRPGCSEHLVLHKMRNARSFIKELDYVAEEDGKLIGQIAYSRMFLRNHKGMSEDIIAFGPISVHPDFQNRGIGGMLIKETMERARELGYKAVLITGNPSYYHRFGFTSASSFGVHLPGVPLEEEASFFMAKELEEGYLSDHPGVYSFDSCFEVEEDELEAFECQFPKRTKREPREDDLM